MSRHTSLKVGGPADLFAIPADADDLQSLVRQLSLTGVPWLAVGRGYNLLVKDGGIRGAVISLERLARIEKQGEERIMVEAGAEVALRTLERSWSRERSIASEASGGRSPGRRRDGQEIGG